MREQHFRSLITGLVALLLTACGGGGGSSSGSDAAPVASLPPRSGSLDTSFSDDGKLMQIPGGLATVHAIAVQPDAKTVVAGQGSTVASHWAVARYLPNGSPDPDFDGDGMVEMDLSGGIYDVPRALVIQPDGKIVVAGGSVNASGDRVFVVMRFHSDGRLDTNFSPGGALAGVVKTGFGGDTAEAYGVALDSANRIVVVGFTRSSALGHDSQDMALARYNSDGTLDTTFEADGKVVTDFAGRIDQAYGVAIDTSNRIVVAGCVGSSMGTEAALVRFDAGGNLDNNFDADGWVTPALHDSGCWQGLALLPDDGIVTAGWGIDSTTYLPEFRLARHDSDGSPDNDFDGDGQVTIDSARDSTAYALALQSDGKIVAAGNTYDPASTLYDFAIARLNPDGSLDATFDGDGKLTIDFDGGDDHAFAVAVQPDGKIVAAGESYSSVSGRGLALARFHP